MVTMRHEMKEESHVRGSQSCLHGFVMRYRDTRNDNNIILFLHELDLNICYSLPPSLPMWMCAQGKS